MVYEKPSLLLVCLVCIIALAVLSQLTFGGNQEPHDAPAPVDQEQESGALIDAQAIFGKALSSGKDATCKACRIVCDAAQKTTKMATAAYNDPTEAAAQAGRSLEYYAKLLAVNAVEIGKEVRNTQAAQVLVEKGSELLLAAAVKTKEFMELLPQDPQQHLPEAAQKYLAQVSKYIEATKDFATPGPDFVKKAVGILGKAKGYLLPLATAGATRVRDGAAKVLSYGWSRRPAKTDEVVGAAGAKAKQFANFFAEEVERMCHQETGSCNCKSEGN